jgi:hypothetical protein
MKTIQLEIDGVWVDAHYDYSEGEAEVTYYPDGSGSPGSPARVDLYKVTAGGKEDIMPVLSDYVIEDIEEQIHKVYED